MKQQSRAPGPGQVPPLARRGFGGPSLETRSAKNDPPRPQLYHRHQERTCAYSANYSMEGPMINRLRDPLILIVALAAVVLAGEVAIVTWL